MSSPKKLSDGRWRVDIRPNGVVDNRVRRIFDTKKEANNFIKKIQVDVYQGKEWNDSALDNRQLSELVDRWYKLHGYTLKTGETKKKYILANVVLLGDPVAREFTAQDFVTFRKNRLEDNLTTVEREVVIKPATVNYDLATLKGVFNKLIELGDWKNPNPLDNVKLLKLDDNEMGFLDIDQIGVLLSCLDQSNSDCVTTISKICLATGARWNEAQSLRREQVRNGKITFYKTKSSKKRTVPIDSDFEKEILSGRPSSGPLYNYCYKSFLRGLKKSGIQLPQGQATHVLRHTFASQFIMAGGNLVTLSKILGHATIQMTMKYAHLAPEYLDDAVHKNPLTLYQQSVKAKTKAA